MSSQALEGVRVLDLTRHVAGPFCTKLLADYGADVIKIEFPGRGDLARWIAPFAGDAPHPERSGLFLHLNTNKRSVTLNLKTGSGRAIFLKMVRSADIVVENFRPRVMPALGLDFATLSQIKPDLVMTSISNFGQTGPCRDWKASDLILYAMGHEMWSTGQPDCEPAGMANKLSLHIAGQVACMATLGAFYGAQFQGVGQQVDLSIMEVLASSIDRRAPSLLAYQYCGERAVRTPSVHGIDVPHSSITAPTAFSNAPWEITGGRNLSAAIGEDWIKDPSSSRRYSTLPPASVSIHTGFRGAWRAARLKLSESCRPRESPARRLIPLPTWSTTNSLQPAITLSKLTIPRPASSSIRERRCG